MFDVGFWELVLIGVVALVVLGPERLPTAARTVGLLLGKLRRTVNDVKSEIEHELRVEEIRRTAREEAAKLTQSMDNIKSTILEPPADLGNKPSEISSEPHVDPNHDAGSTGQR